MDKIYVRACESFSQTGATKPIEVNIEKLRKCEPAYEGNSHKELLEYLYNVWGNYEWVEANSKVYGEDEAYKLCMDDVEFIPYVDSRTKFSDEWLEIGVPTEDWNNNGYFEILEQ